MKFMNLWSLIAAICTLFCVSPSRALDLANITDGSCISQTQFTECEGATGHGCTSTAFYVEFSGNYILTASIDNCGGGTCSHCVSEAYVYEGGRIIGCVHTGCCAEQSIGISLVSGHTYTLYSCLLPCDDANCPADCANCPARARVHT